MIVNDTQNKTFTSSVMNVKISDKGTHPNICFLKGVYFHICTVHHEWMKLSLIHVFSGRIESLILNIVQDLIHSII